MQKYLVIKERNKRINFLNLESELITLRSIVHDCRLSLSTRWLASLRLNQKRLTSTNKINRCFISGRSSGYNRFFRLSRLQFRQKADKLAFVKKV
jgi:ribosomal protein S14